MTSEEFTADLYAFMERKGLPITKVPSLGYQPLDLLLLYKLVIARGGMDAVTRHQEWKAVYQDLHIPTMSTSASYNTRTNYKKYLYLYELEHCDFSDEPPKHATPRYAIGGYIRIVSEVMEGQVFYARIVRDRYTSAGTSDGDAQSAAGGFEYYVHYNGWSNSHDEWMPEAVIGPLTGEEEAAGPETLSNPAPTRSSKSNRIIYTESSAIASPRASPKGTVSPAMGKAKAHSTPASAHPGLIAEAEAAAPLEQGEKFETAEDAVDRDEKSVKKRIGVLLQDELAELTDASTTVVSLQHLSAEEEGRTKRLRNTHKPRVRKTRLHVPWMRQFDDLLLGIKAALPEADARPPTTGTAGAKKQAAAVPASSKVVDLPKDARSTPELLDAIKAAEHRLGEIKDRLKYCTRRLERTYGRAVMNGFLKASERHKAA